MNARYKLAQLKDLDLLLQLVEEFYEFDHHSFDHDKAHKALSDLIKNEGYGRIWLILVGDRPAGYVAITLGYSLEYQGRDAFVDEIFLREAYRGQGIGTQTFAFLEAECQKLGVNALHLEVMLENRKAYDFYRKLKYVDRQSSLLTKWL
ncbi:MAG: GNAT family N-acetyltransferase [Leptolyngbya sp. SIO1E4]|nr:GNAT family N-acetyltransferase [Leptolyngbya sp. SIO1E4]